VKKIISPRGIPFGYLRCTVSNGNWIIILSCQTGGPMAGADKIVAFRASDELASAVACLAALDCLSVSDVVRQALLRDLRQRGLMTPTALASVHMRESRLLNGAEPAKRQQR
jgi:hypothetical protein